MADFVMCTAGSTEVLKTALGGATVKLALSTKTVEEIGAAGVISAGKVPSEITGTGYAQQSQTAPAPSAGKIVFNEAEWKTEAHTDWSASVKSACLIAGGVLICAWNLQAGGAARDLSGANTTERFQPTLILS